MHDYAKNYTKWTIILQNSIRFRLLSNLAGIFAMSSSEGAVQPASMLFNIENKYLYAIIINA
jgi:hypothetical protein